MGASEAADASRTLAAKGRVCLTARYQALGGLFWSGHAGDVTAVQVLAGSDVAEVANLNYWFYGFDALTSVTGLASLPSPGTMLYAFSGCTALTSLDLRGVDPSHLTDVQYCFGGCSALETIWADADWSLPATGVTGALTFFGCLELVGGLGTEYTPANASWEYLRIDDRYGGAPGYLTAG